MKKVSIVVPAFNEEECIPKLIKEISRVFSSLNYCYEIIIIDDGSTDNSFEAIKELAAQNSSLKGIKLSRNMGHQAALDCGLRHATGDAIICMDADLQHPPTLIPRMINLWEKGFEIVTTKKEENEEASGLYRIFANAFYFFFNKYSQIKITPNASDFRLMSRKSLNAVLKMPEYYRFYRGLVPFVGFSTANLTFNVDKRFAGKRKYNFNQSLDLAFNGLLSFSDFALRIPVYLGLIAIAIIFLYLVVVLALHFIFHTGFVKGWSSLITIVTISFGLQFIFMGIMGMYIGKIFFEIKKRPVYFVDETVGKIDITED
jgi:dolichol-phosphate mannosyltransferase